MSQNASAFQIPLPTGKIYLDNAATTVVRPEVALAMVESFSLAYGNPSSLHHAGKAARKVLENARQTLANCLNCQPEELIFTSGGTEADNLAILGLAETLTNTSPGKPHLITSVIEHPAILEPCKKLAAEGWDVTYLPVNSDGFVSVNELEKSLRPETRLVSIMAANNEIGTMQPIEAIGNFLRERNIPFHSDAVQVAGKFPIDLQILPVDYLTVSAHKIHGPKGIGLLYVRNGAPKPSPMQLGGGQEQNIRSGTENLPGIVGFAKAFELALASHENDLEHISQLQQQMLTGVQQLQKTHGHLNIVINGPLDITQRVPGNVHLAIEGAEGESLVLRLDMKGIAVSSGSACHSAIIEPSRVLLALGHPPDIAKGGLRFSIGRDNTKAEIETTLTALDGIFQKLDTHKPTAHV